MEEQNEVVIPPAGALDPNDIHLEPCPFCGGSVELFEDVLGDTPLWYVACCNEQCEARSPLRRSKQAAAAWWNVRPENQQMDDALNEVRNIVGAIQCNIQVVLSALVLERQHPAILAGDAAARNNHLCAILAQTLDVFPHLFEHLNGQENIKYEEVKPNGNEELPN